MKKISILVVIAGLLSVFSVVSSFADDTALTVIAVNGKVLVKVSPYTEWTQLTVGQLVHSQDVVKTELCEEHLSSEKIPVDNKGTVCAACGAATLELADKSSVSLKPDSEMSIDELVMNNAGRKLKVNMSKGELRMIVAKVNTPSDFSVKTPNAVYGATGTIYYVKATPTGTSVYVSDGSISVVNPITGTINTVVAGMVMTFNLDGTSTGPTVATDMDVSGWTANYVDSNSAEPYTPPIANRPNVEPPENTPERGVSGG